MRECAYELYVAVYEAVRQGVVAGDRDVLKQISRHLGGRPGAASLAMTLALLDARRGDPPRTRESFCGDVLCDRTCPAWRDGGPAR